MDGLFFISMNNVGVVLGYIALTADDRAQEIVQEG